MLFNIPVVWRRLIIFFISLTPLIYLMVNAAINQLGADPAKTMVSSLGSWAFYFLLFTLSISPLKRIAKQGWLMSHRRMLGLFTLFYAVLHVLAYLIFIVGLDFSRFAEELIKRPYILYTIPAMALLILLGITSTQKMMRKLGKRWITLHKTIYLVAILAWLHVLLQVRSSYYDAVFFGVLTGLLLGVRVYLVVFKKPPIKRM